MEARSDDSDVSDLAGMCEFDVDECDSDPCKNGATCSPGLHVYSCACEAGWAGGNCDVDTNECSNSPCENGATCSESGMTSSVPVDKFSCSCRPGFANGMCVKSDGNAHCAVTIGGTCNEDINECHVDTDPCLNGATCSDSNDASSIIAHDTFSCHCKPGYANGLCDYAYMHAYAAQCNVVVGGTCNLDANECASNPCKYGGVCTESQTPWPFKVVSVSEYQHFAQSALAESQGITLAAFTENNNMAIGFSVRSRPPRILTTPDYWYWVFLGLGFVFFGVYLHTVLVS